MHRSARATHSCGHSPLSCEYRVALGGKILKMIITNLFPIYRDIYKQILQLQWWLARQVLTYTEWQVASMPQDIHTRILPSYFLPANHTYYYYVLARAYTIYRAQNIKYMESSTPNNKHVICHIYGIHTLQGGSRGIGM